MRGPTIAVVKYTTEQGETYYEEPPELPIAPELLRRRVERADNLGNPITLVSIEQMPREEYERIPATNDSAQFFGAEA